MVMTEEMYQDAFQRASKMGRPDPDLLRWALQTYCSKNGDIGSTFAAMNDDPAEASPAAPPSPRAHAEAAMRRVAPPLGRRWPSRLTATRPPSSPPITCSATSRSESRSSGAVGALASVQRLVTREGVAV